MKTNLDYIIERGQESWNDFNVSAATMFYNSLSPESQEIIADIYTYNGHAYYTTVTHTLNTFHYTDDNQGVSFETNEEMEMYLDGINPTDRIPYREPAARFNLSKSEPEPVEESYIIAYCKYVNKEINDDVVDHYELFLHMNEEEPLQSAQEFFDNLTQNSDTLHSASLCKIIQSTDY